MTKRLTRKQLVGRAKVFKMERDLAIARIETLAHALIEVGVCPQCLKRNDIEDRPMVSLLGCAHCDPSAQVAFVGAASGGEEE